ncbi:MAG TPA: DUF4139 domain-containing protein, partial [Kofleriaceae bacterium]|nr:DUF4139 domain-containing protein [Kofleriaceae bacterium]
LSGRVAISPRDGLGQITQVDAFAQMIGAPVEEMKEVVPGEVMAEIGQLSGREELGVLDARAVGEVEAIVVLPAELRTLLVAEAELGERILRALILRRVALVERGGGVVVIGAAGELAAIDDADAAARARIASAELAAADLAVAQHRLELRIARVESATGIAAARLVIDVIADAACEVALRVDYVVPGAAWRPYHRAVLTRAGGEASVAWQTTACVWQATGEDWTDAELVFSLERPSFGASPPELADDELLARRRPDTVVVEAREQELHTTGLGSGGGGAPSGAPEVPGIDDGGLGVTLSAPRATVLGDGAPHRVAVGGFTARAELDLVAIPLRAACAHVRARLTNTGAAPLLAGPVDLVMASGYVGRGEINFIAPGEKLALGFGPEADVRVHREETRERDEAGLLGGWNTLTVRVVVRVSNLGREPRTIALTERVPVSEVEQVQVAVSAPDAYALKPGDHPGGEKVVQVTARTIDDRGLVAWTVELPSLGRRVVTLEYKVKSQRGVVLD